jgi:hypothetical protein
MGEFPVGASVEEKEEAERQVLINTELEMRSDFSELVLSIPSGDSRPTLSATDSNTKSAIKSQTLSS